MSIGAAQEGGQAAHKDEPKGGAGAKQPAAPAQAKSVPGQGKQPPGKEQPAAPPKDQMPPPIPEKPIAEGEEEDAHRAGSTLPPVESSSLKTLFLGGGAYCFQRHMQFAYPGTAVDVAEIDPAVTRANFMATGLPRETPIQTHWGDARQFVELHQDTNQYDLIFGDAFNDFSVPWHLTTREFNEKISKMLTPTGVYMINIIDAYESDANALHKAEEEIERKEVGEPAVQTRVRARYLAEARRYGGFVGAWTKTAKLTFPNVYIFGTDEPGRGLRETFVVVASKQPLDLEELGDRKDDPRFYSPRGRQTRPRPYGTADEQTVVEERSRKIILTDDYAPVENLLAPVAETRGDE